MERLVVLDGNPICYRAYHSPGTRHLHTSTGIRSGLFYGFLRTYQALKKRLPKAHFVVCFDAGRSWRNDACAEYKTHAEDSKPNGFATQMRDVLAFIRLVGIPVFQEKMLEADDLISVLTSMWLEVNKTHTAIIVSSDRDYFQLVSDRVMLYDDRAKKFYGPKEIENLLGVKLQYFLNYKCLMGDKADCLSGVYGYGPSKARQFCQNPHVTLFGADMEIFTRNKRLMTLPRTIQALPLMSKQRTRLRIAMTSLLTVFAKNIQRTVHDAGDLTLALDLLNYYECHSLKVDDFLPQAQKDTVT